MDKVGPLPQVSLDLGLPLEEETNQGHTIIMSGTGGEDLKEEIIKDFPEGQQDLEAKRTCLYLKKLDIEAKRTRSIVRKFISSLMLAQSKQDRLQVLTLVYYLKVRPQA